MQGNPFRGIRLLVEANERVKFLEDQEEAQLLAPLPIPVRQLVVVAHETGFRKSALLALQWPDVDFRVGTVTLRRDKAGQVLRLPVNSRALEALAEVRRWQIQRAREVFRGTREILSSNVFCTPKGGRLHNLHRDYWGPAREAAGIQDLHFHDLRHSWASRLAMTGADPYTVQRAGGWKTPIMVQRYAHLSQDHVRAAVERLVTVRKIGATTGSLSGSSTQPSDAQGSTSSQLLETMKPDLTRD